ncbi:hypothetical protein CMI38_01380 [Candidatus Pacearchaeota archaeon]|jgi:hypothetical protein|nr:hypothetical protein [Candidatus Pacearchaeota archaeon]|tara:strand:- start:1171 stop:1548 length:378 start_codon:yes stop_codon:yes gene_type:complete
MRTTYNWDNPRPLEEDEDRYLERLVKDISSGRFELRRTSEEEYQATKREIETNYKDISQEDLTRCLHTIEDYCATKLIETDSKEEQIYQMRRIDMIYKALQDLNPDLAEDLGATIFEYLLIRKNK